MHRKHLPFAAGLMTAVSGLAQAHPGHGVALAAHPHASDAWGWALGLAAVALVLWLMRRR